MFGGFQSKSVIRKVSVAVPVKPKPVVTENKSANPKSQISDKPNYNSKRADGARTIAPNRTKRSSSPVTRTESLVKRAVKRKALTPPPQWGESDDDNDDDSNDIESRSSKQGVASGANGQDSNLPPSASRKRIKSASNSVDPSRILFRQPSPPPPPSALTDDSHTQSINIIQASPTIMTLPDNQDQSFPLAHSADLVSNPSTSHKFRPFFLEEIASSISLQYPSSFSHSNENIQHRAERFYLADSIDIDGYKSSYDILETIRQVCLHYLPRQESEECSDDLTGFVRRLTRTMKGDLSTSCKDEFIKTIDEYNSLITKRLHDGTIERVLRSKHGLTFDWMKRILDQVYSRTVSPHVDMLKDYINGTDNVYGELLYPLVSEMFRETGLKSNQVFVDLGSGVGNVVLQAALEIGCEAWGCEMMPNPCGLADLQAEEFNQRARLWGVHVGRVRLVKGDFLETKEIAAVLKRADVVLVNNQAFGPDLNSKLIDKFLDLKDGCQVISLKSFKPDGFEIQDRNINDVRHLLKVRKLEYFSGRVSWTDAPGNYYIATKDPSELIKYHDGQKRKR